MPIYVYRCESCGAIEEHMQRLADPPATECGTCGGPLRKQVAAAAFHLKGGGWYKDGYASTKPASGAESSGSSGSDGAATSGSGEGGSASTPSTPSTPGTKTPTPSTKTPTPSPKSGGGKGGGAKAKE